MMNNSLGLPVGNVPTTILKLAANLILKARRAIRDPNHFIEFALMDSQGERLQQATVHRELQAFLSTHSRALIELPRDHGKSVQVCGRILWELGHRPSLRVKLVCATDALAAERSRFLRDTIEQNPIVPMLFPHLKPNDPWSAQAFTIHRPSHVIGPSVSAVGLGTGSTGARADLLICDDVVDVRSLQSAAERERAKAYFHNNLMNLLEPDGRFWGLCTPWHGADLNAELKANPAFHVFRRAVGPNLESVWPEKWTRERLEARKREIGSASFARGYFLTPVAQEELLIPRDWVAFYDDALEHVEYDLVMLSVDPAIGTTDHHDATGLVVIGRRATGEIDCLEANAVRLALPDLVTLLGQWDARWQPDEILFESNAAFAGIRDLLVRHTTFGPRIKSLVQSKSKHSRIAALSVLVEQKRVRFKREQTALFDEMTTYPHAAHDDLVDALASGVHYLTQRFEPRVWSF
jgi:predicted phage terminase large subunit-like protein